MRCSARLRWVALVCGLASGSLLRPEPALAHPPPEVWHIASSTPDDVILVTTRGLIFGNLLTRSFRYLCVEGFDEGSSVQYRVAKLPSGRLLMAASDGLQGSDDRGCSWHKMPALVMPASATMMEPSSISTPFMLQDQTALDHLYVATYGVGQGGVQLTVDGGESFSKLLSVSDDDYVGSLLLVPGQPLHLYAGITHFPPDTDFTYFIQHSADGGNTWDRNQVPLNTNEVDLTLLAVNPVEPLQLVARASAMEPIDGERLLFSRDGGKTFTSPLTVRALRAAAFSDDGKLLYVGGRDGIVRAQVGDSDALSFSAMTGATRISAIEQVDDQLLGCGYYQGDDVGVNGIGVAKLDALGSAPTSFTRWMDFYEVTDVIDCPASAPVTQKCAQLFRDYEVENPPPLPGMPSVDGGVPAVDGSVTGLDASAPSLPDAALDAAVRAAPHKGSSGGCAVADARSDCPGLGGLLLTIVLAARYRARRKQDRQEI